MVKFWKWVVQVLLRISEAVDSWTTAAEVKLAQARSQTYYPPISQEFYFKGNFESRREGFIYRRMVWIKDLKLDQDAISVMGLLLREYDEFLQENGCILPKFEKVSCGNDNFTINKTYSCALDLEQVVGDLMGTLDHLRFRTGDLTYSSAHTLNFLIEYSKNDKK